MQRVGSVKPASQPSSLHNTYTLRACASPQALEQGLLYIYMCIYAWQVLKQGLPLLEELNSVPARKPTATAAVYGAAAKAGGDVRSRIDQDYRPLLKVQVAACAGS